MSYEKVWVIRDKQHAPRVIDDLRSWVDQWDFNHALVIKPGKYTNPRSLSQNALVHTWFNTMAKHFSKKVEVDADQMKLLMKNKFLGTEDVVVGSTVIEGQLKRTSKLTKGEMTYFMDRVHEWAADHGVNLPIPADSEYMKLMEAQRG
jgi:hypothetical protein